MKYFRFWLRKGQVRQFLWILGGAWRPLLLLEYKKNEMDWCREILRGSGRTFGLCHLKCHQRVCLPGDGEQRLPWQTDCDLVRRLRLWRWDQLEVDRLQSLSTLILGAKRTKQPECWRMYATSVVLEAFPYQSQVERLVLPQTDAISVHEEDLRSRDQQPFGQSNPNAIRWTNAGGLEG